MRHRAAAVLAAMSVAFLPGCGTGNPGQSATAAAAHVVKRVPGLVGKGLQTAEDDARAAGFASFTSHDATARGRVQILAIDWKVCFQSPAPGSRVPTTHPLRFGVVRLAEKCPATDRGAVPPPQAAEGRPMPDLTGWSLNVAVGALPASTSVTSRDLTGRHRLVIVASDWQVCTQRPRPGATFRGQPVTFGVVKFGEHCP